MRNVPIAEARRTISFPTSIFAKWNIIGLQVMLRPRPRQRAESRMRREWTTAFQRSRAAAAFVGGNAYGSTARKSDPQSPEGKANKAAILQKGADHAKAGGTDLTTKRGHGFLHQIDERFREKDPTVDNALKDANDLLDELVEYENPPDADCVKVAKECIKQQMAAAKKKNAKLNKKAPRSGGVESQAP